MAGATSSARGVVCRTERSGTHRHGALPYGGVVRCLTVTSRLASYAPVVSEQERRDEELAEGAEPVFPATDPVLSPSGRVLGGFARTSMDSVGVAPSTLDNRPGDEALAHAIRRELREDASTASLQIHVEVRGSVAFLHGRVDGLEDADNAAEVASRVRGVRQVVEQLTVPEP